MSRGVPGMADAGADAGVVAGVADAEQAIAAVIADAVTSEGYVIEGVRWVTASTLRILDVLVDRSEPITLDEVATASRLISAALDASDVLGDDPYTLQVGSPGVDMPLTLPRHWRRAVGRRVDITVERCSPDVPEEVIVRAVVRAVDDVGVTVDVDPADQPAGAEGLAQSGCAAPISHLPYPRIRCGRVLVDL